MTQMYECYDVVYDFYDVAYDLNSHAYWWILISYTDW